MSLLTDTAFIAAINANEELMGKIGSRLYGTFIQEPEESEANKTVPYILVTYDGGTNSAESKDAHQNEGSEDNVSITVEITAKTRPGLAEIASLCRDAIRDYMEEGTDTEAPIQYDLRLGAVNYDTDAPCYWQQLTYQCVTNR